MKATDFLPGDHVIYVDPDQIQWGPWQIVQVQRHAIVVSIEGLIEHTIPRHRVQKVEQNRD